MRLLILAALLVPLVGLTSRSTGVNPFCIHQREPQTVPWDGEARILGTPTGRFPRVITPFALRQWIDLADDGSYNDSMVGQWTPEDDARESVAMEISVSALSGVNENRYYQYRNRSESSKAIVVLWGVCSTILSAPRDFDTTLHWTQPIVISAILRDPAGWVDSTPTFDILPTRRNTPYPVMYRWSTNDLTQLDDYDNPEVNAYDHLTRHRASDFTVGQRLSAREYFDLLNSMPLERDLDPCSDRTVGNWLAAHPDQRAVVPAEELWDAVLVQPIKPRMLPAIPLDEIQSSYKWLCQLDTGG